MQPPVNLFSVIANIERHKIDTGEPWLLLMCIEYPGDGTPEQPGVTITPGRLYFVRDLNPFVFDANDGHGPQTYTPFNFSVGSYQMSSSGSVPSCQVTASNVMRALESIVDQYAGIVGANLYLYAVNTANPLGEPDLAMAFTVTKTIADAKAVNFTLGASSPLRRLFPFYYYRPNFCGWQYNSPALQAAAAIALAADPNADVPGLQCGYIGSLPTCDRTIDGPNGCQAHFGTQPLRALSFPGIDTNGAVIGSVA